MTFMAHPDDAEVCCGGSLALYSAKGHEVGIAIACNGDKGNFTIPPEELARIREAEAREAADLIGAQVFCLGIEDSGICYNQPTLHKVVETIRRFDPDVIFTHVTEDYHLDHKTTSRLVVDASFITSVPAICPSVKATSKSPQIYFVEPYAGHGFIPGDYVDITQTIEIKAKMMECHKSQITWMEEHDNTDIFDYLHTVAKYRGFQCGVPYAEGFIRYCTALRSAPGYFLP